jgi:hypothetical protein
MTEQASPLSTPITLHQAIIYEIGGSWWASWVGYPPLQRIVSKYFAWKASRKLARYKWLLGTPREARR